MYTHIFVHKECQNNMACVCVKNIFCQAHGTKKYPGHSSTTYPEPQNCWPSGRVFVLGQEDKLQKHSNDGEVHPSSNTQSQAHTHTKLKVNIAFMDSWPSAIPNIHRNNVFMKQQLKILETSSPMRILPIKINPQISVCNKASLRWLRSLWSGTTWMQPKTAVRGALHPAARTGELGETWPTWNLSPLDLHSWAVAPRHFAIPETTTISNVTKASKASIQDIQWMKSQIAGWCTGQAY